MKDYRVEVKVKNNYLLRVMESNGYKNANQLAKAIGMDPTQVGKMINLKITPYKTNGELSKAVERVCVFLGVMPCEIFPPQHMDECINNNKSEVEVSMSDLAGLSDGIRNDPLAIINMEESASMVHKSLDALTDRERAIITMRYGLDGEQFTQLQIAKKYEVTVERIRQIEAGALRKLRSPKATDHMLICDGLIALLDENNPHH